MILQSPSGSRQPEAEVQAKPLSRVLKERRATAHFTSKPIPEEVLQSILELSLQAPSGYNLQPWRFIVVREQANRERLQKAAMDQPKISEAPVVVIAIGMKQETKDLIEEVVKMGVEHGAGRREDASKIVKQATKFLDGFLMDVWVNRHVMIAFTSMMLLAEAFGIDTAPMEGFDPEAVRKEFGIPADGEVIALLAMGYVKEPDKAFPGRFPLSRLVFSEKFGASWK